jgi:hypothetical protein
VVYRLIVTVVLAGTLLLGGLLVPTAGALGTDVPTPTRMHRLDGLRAAPSVYADAGTASRSDGPAGTESEPTDTGMAFSMLGFELPAGADVAFRTATDGSDWTDWRWAHRHDDETPDPRSDEAAAGAVHTGGAVLSAPTWVGEARWLQTRVTGAGPEDVAVHLIDSAGLGRSLGQRTLDAFRAAWRGDGGAVAHAIADQPSITTRAQWGADESIRTSSGRAARRARVAFVHHTVSTNDYGPADGPALVRGIYAYHVQANGWSDIGYNFLVDRYGRIYEGRYGGIERAVIGAHAGGFNTSTVGIAMIGDHSAVSPPTVAMDALARLLAWKLDVHHIDPLATWELTSGGSTRYPSGTAVRLSTISGHRDVSATACPGGALYAQLPALRQRVAQLIGDALFDHDASPTLVHVSGGVPTSNPVRLSTRLVPEGEWTLDVRDPDGTVVYAAGGSGATATASWSIPEGATLGRYTYTFASQGRRSARGPIDVLSEVFTRLGASGDPVAGAVEVSQAAFPDDTSAAHAVVARSDVFADTMAGGPLAGTQGPVLLTPSGGLDSRVRAELERVLPAGRLIYVLGGTAALSDQVVADLADRWQVQRIGGAERTETAAQVARVVQLASGTTTALIARAGPDSAAPWADALAGGAYGAHHGIPVLLTPSDRLAVPARQVMDDLGITDTIVLGGTAAVSSAVAQELPAPRRVAGGDRTETAVAIAEQLWGRTAGADGDRILLGGAFRGDAWALALAAAPLAARTEAPLLLTNTTALSSATGAYLARLAYPMGADVEGWVLGSRQAVSDATVEQALGSLW